MDDATSTGVAGRSVDAYVAFKGVEELVVDAVGRVVDSVVTSSLDFPVDACTSGDGVDDEGVPVLEAASVDVVGCSVVEVDVIGGAESDVASGRSVLSEVKEKDARSSLSAFARGLTSVSTLTPDGAAVVVDVVVVVVDVVVGLGSDGGSDQTMITGSSSEGLPDSGFMAAGADFVVVVVGKGVVVVGEVVVVAVAAAGVVVVVVAAVVVVVVAAAVVAVVA